MSEWLALLYKLKPGNAEAVSEIFRQTGRPDHDIHGKDGSLVGRLLTTMVFVGNEAAVRVIEVEGDIRAVAGHISQQPEVKEFEGKIEEFLAEPRDLSTPEGAAHFFQRSGMRNVFVRRHDD